MVLKKAKQLLELGLFIFDVFAHHGIEFQNLQFFWCCSLVFRGCVKMTGAGRRFKLYFFPHDCLLLPKSRLSCP